MFSCDVLLLKFALFLRITRHRFAMVRSGGTRNGGCFAAGPGSTNSRDGSQKLAVENAFSAGLVFLVIVKKGEKRGILLHGRLLKYQRDETRNIPELLPHAGA